MRAAVAPAGQYGLHRRPPKDRRPWPGGGPTPPQSTRRGRFRAPASRRATRAASRPSAAVAGRRGRGSRRTRSVRGAHPLGRIGTRSAAPNLRWPPIRVPRRERQRGIWPERRLARARRGAPGRASAWSLVRGMRRQPISLLALERGRRSAQARRRRPRQTPASLGQDARRGDRDRPLGRSRRPARDGPLACPPARPLDTRSSGLAGDGRSRSRRS